MDVYLHLPAGHQAESGDDPLPLVVMYPDAFGVRPATLAMADRLAGLGYAVALPNVFYRTPDAGPFDAATAFSDPEARTRLFGVMAKANPTAVMADTRALLAALDDAAGVNTERIGATGYCMGGRLAFIAAGTFGDRVAAAASHHGGRLAVEDDPDSPHKRAADVRARLYFGVADQDGSCTPEDQARLAAALDEAKVDYRIELYPGALHGYAVSDFPVYDEAAAERHWDRTAELFADVLKAGAA
ncbi:dienelactone hydrolase family protein [Frankia sp. CNm7]|uniref:Dienelactone hydrolase family protein n=2 Tax=Frankia nepalensis TaxID=1836974 RepID=A0A937RUI6_9ACTN|nr:dienelactone hydrolase family protein [Frankia nepalensis]MBL7513956.1 dienelactone hydrolase family protein [Frankia nepalensis]MBL7519921.1 dienelactone hydrolase family protein [Frankia nepalensis]MBL7633068.1 dienelactone hydrolase family protein [Frankia nepalensis]